jgi:hypothetical protein
VGSNANFTDIFETLSGVVDGLLANNLPKGFKILIRRGGPRWQEAFEMVEDRLKDKDIQLKLFGPDFSIVKTARELKKCLKKIMAILINKNTKYLIQGITGKEGTRALESMQSLGAQVLAGVTPGKGGEIR